MTRLIRTLSIAIYLTIIPRARMGSESIADEAKGYSKIQLVGQKHRLDKTTLASKT